ncbi:Tex family protein [Coraliomargarita akajimensis]|uniref:Tex-like protein protein n=1 Tax=Coraliomargarita akajimensis (strain DSM 45221 / IAM 15411 / JCM 23193 / KCTC 12865 / 04OKA010-24) TaxID=583355 RepID=D5EIC0_CORAD|nr:Tex family protein [Coraliomargarita akajimensis]ADE54186.1 Tex-like protein protein [Coraliomargarita akajimensis DSM 45221]
MHTEFFDQISAELKLGLPQVASTIKLLDEGGTVPFIARYRKEQTGELDEVQITAIRDRYQQLKDVQFRRESILKSLDERQLLTEELKGKLNTADTLSKLEDIYLPFRPKRRTKATIAREKGLEPLAQYLFDNQNASDCAEQAAPYVDADKEVDDINAAIEGARHIIAEWISDDADARDALRTLFWKQGTLSSEVMMGKEDEAAKFRDYFDWKEPIAKAPSHRVLAIRRGEKEGFLFHRILPEQESAIAILEKQFLNGHGSAAAEVKKAIEDSYKRLLSHSMEGEARLRAKKEADGGAIQVFSDNVRELLLASPLGQKRIMAVDPGFRTGCKTVILDAQGNLIFNHILFCTGSQAQVNRAKMEAKALAEQHSIEAVAIGNGTASRETESFFRELGLPKQIPIIVVNESGASIYSASEVAREEFPNEDITVRGAVSIGRRLMDPLAELVKIDPKSIGVGQYQHDVDQNALKHKLDDTVISCVNNVGVEVNTASKQLLAYVSGLNESIAGNIVTYRIENGPFKSREELNKVTRLGPKAYEQCAGFLRIRGAANPLDESAVHPERYALVEQMAADAGCSVAELLTSSAARNQVKLENYVSDQVGLPTLRDIMDELAKPGRDPRAQFELFQFAEGVEKPSDLTLGIKLPGIVTNVTAFGAFVDVGVHQDGLVHVSQLADKFVEDPNQIVKVGDKVQVTVTELDLQRNRISLSMRARPEIGGKKERGGRPGGQRDNQRGGKQRAQKTRNDFGGNWFDNALSKKH